MWKTMNGKRGLLVAICALVCSPSLSAMPVPAEEGAILPKPDQAFTGKIGTTTEDEVPAWPKLYTFQNPAARPPSRIQYFEMSGNRAIYKYGWKATARHSVIRVRKNDNDFAGDRWELYNVELR